VQLDRIVAAFESGVTPLIRTDFGNDDAWQAVVAQVSEPVDFAVADSDESGADSYAPNVTIIDDRAFEGVDARMLAEAIGPAGEIVGYVLLADSRSMSEVCAAGLTLDYVDLSVMGPEDAELFRSFTGRSFRVAVGEVAGIEANLAIANMDFHEFADAAAPDGVFRGFEAAAFHEPVWPVEREAGLSAASAVLADLTGGPAARPLHGQLGEVVLDREFKGTRTRLFNRVGYAYGWPLSMGASGNGSLEVGSEVRHDATLPDAEDPYDRQGEIRTRILEVDKPSRVVRTWNWLLPTPATSTARSRGHKPLLERDAVVTVEFTKAGSPREANLTRVRVRVVGIPAEWEADFRALWAWDIARLAALD